MGSDHRARRAKGTLLIKLYESAGDLGATELIELLRDGLAAAVITTAEDKHLGSRYGSQMPSDYAPNDLWARYTASGFDVSTFAPLEGG